jgi:hypothetical protein
MYGSTPKSRPWMLAAGDGLDDLDLTLLDN